MYIFLINHIKSLDLSSIQSIKKKIPSIVHCTCMPQEIITSFAITFEISSLTNCRHRSFSPVRTWGCACICTYVCRIDRSATTASCASSSPSRNADLSPGISLSWCCCWCDDRSSRDIHEYTTDSVVCIFPSKTVYRCRFSVIPTFSLRFLYRGSKEDQERAPISRVIICDVPGLWFDSKNRFPFMLALFLRSPPWGARNRPTRLLTPSMALM